MNLIIQKSDARQLEADKVTSGPHYLSHENEPIDLYRKYKDSDFLPLNGGRNLQNLFDDSDVKDYYWFNIARKTLSKY
jgi:hypothetical protein